MTDFLIFLAGAIVTLMVGAAVGLLVWGAANEEGEPERRRAATAADQVPPPAL